MQALYEKYEKKGVVVLTVSADRTSIEKIQDYNNKMELTFPTLHDQTMEVTRMFAVRGFPTTYILNAEGKIIAAAIGPRPWDGEDVQKLVERLLEEAND